MSRPKCDRAVGRSRCKAWPIWKVREPGDRMERNWLYACGRHLNSVAKECAFEAGDKLDLVRILDDR